MSNIWKFLESSQNPIIITLNDSSILYKHLQIQIFYKYGILTTHYTEMVEGKNKIAFVNVIGLI